MNNWNLFRKLEKLIIITKSPGRTKKKIMNNNNSPAPPPLHGAWARKLVLSASTSSALPASNDNSIGDHIGGNIAKQQQATQVTSAAPKPVAAAAAPPAAAVSAQPGSTVVAVKRTPQIQQQLRELERAEGGKMSGKEREAIKAHLKSLLRTSDDHQREAAERKEAKRKQTEERWKRGEVNPFQPSTIQLSDFAVKPANKVSSNPPPSSASGSPPSLPPDATSGAKGTKQQQQQHVMTIQQQQKKGDSKQQANSKKSSGGSGGSSGKNQKGQPQLSKGAQQLPTAEEEAKEKEKVNNSTALSGAEKVIKIQTASKSSIVIVRNRKPGALPPMGSAQAATQEAQQLQSQQQQQQKNQLHSQQQQQQQQARDDARQRGSALPVPKLLGKRHSQVVPGGMAEAPHKLKKQKPFTAQRRPTAIKRAVHRARQNLFEMYADDVDAWYDKVVSSSPDRKTKKVVDLREKSSRSDDDDDDDNDSDALSSTSSLASSSSSSSSASSRSHSSESSLADELADIVVGVALELENENASSASAVGDVVDIQTEQQTQEEHQHQSGEQQQQPSAVMTPSSSAPTVLPGNLTQKKLRHLHAQVTRTRRIVRQLQEQRARVHKAFLSRNADDTRKAVSKLRKKMEAVRQVVVPHGGILQFHQEGEEHNLHHHHHQPQQRYHSDKQHVNSQEPGSMATITINQVDKKKNNKKRNEHNGDNKNKNKNDNNNSNRQKPSSASPAPMKVKEQDEVNQEATSDGDTDLFGYSNDNFISNPTPAQQSKESKAKRQNRQDKQNTKKQQQQQQQQQQKKNNNASPTFANSSSSNHNNDDDDDGNNNDGGNNSNTYDVNDKNQNQSEKNTNSDSTKTKQQTTPAAEGATFRDDVETREIVTEKLSHLFYPRLWSYEGVGLHPKALQVDRRINVQSWPPGRLVRDYVTNVLSRELDSAISAFLTKLQHANAKLRSQQPLHYKARMRYVLGFREVLRGIIVGRVKFVIVAPDVEPAPGPGGLDEHLMKILSACGILYRPTHNLLDSARCGTAPAAGSSSNSSPPAAVSAAAAKQDSGDSKSISQAQDWVQGGKHHPPRCIFGMCRSALAKVFHQKDRLISIVGVFSADPAYEELRTMLAIAGSHVEEYGRIAMSPMQASAPRQEEVDKPSAAPCCS